MNQEIDIESNNKVLAFLEQNSEILAQLETIEEIKEFSDILLDKLHQTNLQTANPLIINFLVNNILGKIFSMIKKDELPESIIKLIDFLIEKDLMNNVFKMIYKDMYSNSLKNKYEIMNLDKIEDKDIEKKFNLNLDVLLNLDTRIESYVNKCFGYSLLDLNGDIIWCDHNTEKFFEVNKNNMEEDNIFKKMISYSKDSICQKFDLKYSPKKEIVELFGENSKIGDSIAFSYVIYSKDNLSKYIKHIRKKEIYNYDQIKEYTRKDNNKNTLFYKYLKALSSKATLVVLKFSKKEFADVLKNQKYKINITNGINNIIHDFKNKNKNLNDDDIIYKAAIFYETRLARKIPAYDFESMFKDKQIVDFENIVKEKINKLR